MAPDRVTYDLGTLPFGFFNTWDIKGIKNETINGSPQSFWGSYLDDNFGKIRAAIHAKFGKEAYREPVIFKNDGVKSFNEITQRDLNRLCIYIWTNEKWGQRRAAPKDCKFYICCGVPTQTGSAATVLNAAFQDNNTMELPVKAGTDFTTAVFPALMEVNTNTGRIIDAITKHETSQAGKGGGTP